jgi:hypothetical protein
MPKQMTSLSTLPTNNQKDVRFTNYKITHTIYTRLKRQQYNKQIQINNHKEKKL